jgi:hypothetical protein
LYLGVLSLEHFEERVANALADFRSLIPWSGPVLVLPSTHRLDKPRIQAGDKAVAEAKRPVGKCAVMIAMSTLSVIQGSRHRARRAARPCLRHCADNGIDLRIQGLRSTIPMFGTANSDY